jgi:transposase-like protein
MLDGHLNKCKECVKLRVHKYRDVNIDRIKEYDKKRSMTPSRVKARQEYVKTESGKKSRQRAKENYKNHFPMKHAAHILFRNAVRDKKIIRADFCSICKSTYKVEGHHDDYTKPLEVRWMCESCHKKWHRENNAIYE